jgi:hypothetical protein
MNRKCIRSVTQLLPIFAALTLAVPANAQALGPGFDWGAASVNAVNALINLQGGVYVQHGIDLVAMAAMCRLLWGLLWNLVAQFDMLHSMHHHRIGVEDFLKIIALAFFCVLGLNQWMVGANFHAWPMNIAGGLASELDQGQINQFQQFVSGVAVKLNKPNPLALLDVIVYVFILLDMGVLSFVTFILTAFGFVGEAIFVVITPLFFWATFFRTTFSWFWNCVQAMFAFAFYRVMSSVVLWLLANLMVKFFVKGIGCVIDPNGNAVGCDWSLGGWMAMLVPVLTLTGMFLFALLLIPLLCASVFNGAGAIGEAATGAVVKSGRAAGAALME